MNTSEVDSNIMRHVLPPKSCLFDNVPPYPHKAAAALTFRMSCRKYLLPAACELETGVNLKTEPAGSCGRSQDRSQNLLQPWLPFSTNFKAWNCSRIDIFSCAAGATLDLAPRPLSSRSNYSKP